MVPPSHCVPVRAPVRPSRPPQVRGHTNAGMASPNLEDELAWSRAANVCEHLVACGAKPGQLQLEGLGSREMVAPPTGTDAFKNSRVEFWPLW